ncbi:MAG: serine/threonine-protein phosphatase [Deltaproteobacteria bacterium]|nr:serine/threonine-protein phosphatase [Deltaproteobacteria bacterium]
MKSNGAIHFRVKGPHFDAIGISDPGRARSENEDSIYLDEAGQFVLLADGMGGHERGAEASRTAVNVIQEYLQPEVLTEQLMDITDVEGVSSEIVCLSSLVGDAVEKANAVIYGHNQEGQLKRYMGTTVVGLVPVKDGLILWFHVGDSRIYRCRDSVLQCLTSDHSAYAEWVRNGREGEKPAKNIITRAVGPHTVAMPDIGWDKQQKDDIYVLCSDGLTDMISEDQISEILNPEDDLGDMAQRLIDAANEAGGKDNVSAVVCKI